MGDSGTPVSIPPLNSLPTAGTEAYLLLYSQQLAFVNSYYSLLAATLPLLCFIYFAALGFEPRLSGVLSKYSTTELYP